MNKPASATFRKRGYLGLAKPLERPRLPKLLFSAPIAIGPMMETMSSRSQPLRTASQSMTGPVQIEGSASELAKEARKKARSLYSVYLGTQAG